tara:strand:- start:77 stop:1075 length:999 start_codon:yes stop_codon:yes gene_type:complete
MAISWAGLNKADDERRASLREDSLRKEDLANSRENAFLQLKLNTIKEKSAFSSTPAAISATQDALKFKDRVASDESLSEEIRNIYNGIVVSDPFAAQEIYKFQQVQSKEFQRNLNLSQVYDLMTISTMSIPVKEKMDLLKVSADIDFTDKEQFHTLMSKVASITTTPARTTVIDFDTASNLDSKKLIEQQSAQLSQIMKALEGDLMSKLEDLAVESKSADEVVKREALKEISKIEGVRKDIKSSDPLIKYRAQQYYFTFLTEAKLNQFIKDDQSLYNADEIPEVKTALRDNRATNPIPNGAIELLKSNPSNENKKAFDIKYGPGSANRILGL